MAFAVFIMFVGSVLGLSFFLGRKAKSAKGYYAAHGQINWFVNGIAFAGDYLSAASFLGICGMIAFYGYDGFLYSIGFLAGWVVALFVIAEPLKRLGKFTFADALDSKFNSQGIKLSAAISTLIVSLFYLIPQMVGAGTLIQPLLGLPTTFPAAFHGFGSFELGVLIVGVVVITIVVTAGMVSTTWVQFIKGSLLVIFCVLLTFMILHRGFTVAPTPTAGESLTLSADKTQTFVDGKPQGHGPGEADLQPVGSVAALPGGMTSTGPLGPLQFITTFQKSKIVIWSPDKKVTNKDGSVKSGFSPKVVSGNDLLLPGGSPTFKGIRSEKLVDKLDFISLMIALFCGTASLPHILIRYYTVKDGAAARKSTVVGIASIGFFYVLTLFLGLGAMTSHFMDPTNSNMAAPLLAKSFGELPFAVISAIAFTTVLGTVSGLIMAASGAVAHDLMANFLKITMDDHRKVAAGKVVAVLVGIIAMVLGVLFKKMNVGFLVGWAFNVAASANLPALVMLLFWKRTTKQGITAAITIGLITSLAWLLLSAPAYKDVYNLDPTRAIAPFSQPGIVTIPLGFVVLVVVSLLTPKPQTLPVKEFEPELTPVG
jgi:cation/acetate symporter